MAETDLNHRRQENGLGSGEQKEQSVINKEDWLDNSTWFCQTRKQESEDESAPGVIREVPVLGQSALGLASRGLDSSTAG